MKSTVYVVQYQANYKLLAGYWMDDTEWDNLKDARQKIARFKGYKTRIIWRTIIERIIP